jgi:hypothetical protein
MCCFFFYYIAAKDVVERDQYKFDWPTSFYQFSPNIQVYDETVIAQ